MATDVSVSINRVPSAKQANGARLSSTVLCCICIGTNLRQVRDVPSVDAHLLQQDRDVRVPLVTIGPSRVNSCTTYLCNFQELGDSCHSCEELLVNIKSLFALDFLHVKIFLCQQQSTKTTVRIPLTRS